MRYLPGDRGGQPRWHTLLWWLWCMLSHHLPITAANQRSGRRLVLPAMWEQRKCGRWRCGLRRWRSWPERWQWWGFGWWARAVAASHPRRSGHRYQQRWQWRRQQRSWGSGNRPGYTACTAATSRPSPPQRAWAPAAAAAAAAAAALQLGLGEVARQCSKRSCRLPPMPQRAWAPEAVAAAATLQLGLGEVARRCSASKSLTLPKAIMTAVVGLWPGSHRWMGSGPLLIREAGGQIRAASLQGYCSRWKTALPWCGWWGVRTWLPCGNPAFKEGLGEERAVSNWPKYAL